MYLTDPKIDSDINNADPVIINEMSKYLKRPPVELSDTIEKWNYDSLTGIYLTMHDRLVQVRCVWLAAAVTHPVFVTSNPR